MVCLLMPEFNCVKDISGIKDCMRCIDVDILLGDYICIVAY